VSRVPSTSVSSTNELDDDDGDGDFEMPEDEDVAMEDVVPKKPAMRRKPKTLIPVGRNGLKKRKVTKTRRTVDANGYMRRFSLKIWPEQFSFISGMQVRRTIQIGNPSIQTPNQNLLNPKQNRERRLPELKKRKRTRSCHHCLLPMRKMLHPRRRKKRRDRLNQLLLRPEQNPDQKRQHQIPKRRKEKGFSIFLAPKKHNT
jgi:hypothetical protein